MAKEKTTKGSGVVMHQVDVESLFAALYRNGEARLSDHYIDE